MTNIEYFILRFINILYLFCFNSFIYKQKLMRLSWVIIMNRLKNCYIYGKILCEGDFMIKKYVIGLIDICKEIDFEYDKLMELSEKNQEKTQNYENHLSLVESYLQVAIEYCYKFSVEDLQKILNFINKLVRDNPDGFGYNTSCKIVDYVLVKKHIANKEAWVENDGMENEELFDDDVYEEYSDDDVLEELFDEMDFSFDDNEDVYVDEVIYDEEIYDDEFDEIDSFDGEEIYDSDDLDIEDYPEELDDFYDEAMNIIYVRAARNLISQLLDIDVHNEDEKRYRAQLIALYQTEFKYDFLSSSVSLELISIKAHFNPFRMFFTTDMDFRAIYFNEVLNNIRILYERDCEDVSQRNVLEDYFIILCIDEMLNFLDHDRLLKLKDACNMLNERVSLDEYTDICLRKIRERLNLS